jgi:hypothetical protein
MYNKNIIAIFLISIIFSSCKKDCSELVDTSKVVAEVKVVNLESEIATLKTVDDAEKFLQKHSLFTSYHLDAGIPRELLVKQLLFWGSPLLDTLRMDVKTQFGDFASTKTQIEDVVKRTKFFFPNFQIPEVNTMVSGFGDYVISDVDSLLLIGLDYFLDSSAHYQPHREEMPDYIKRHLNPNTVDVKTAFSFSNRLVEVVADQKLINQMIKFGKQYYYMSQVLPCKKEYELFDYSANDWAEIKSNEFTIYSFFTKNELFYNTKGENVRLFLSDRPNCVEIGDKCPGRIGRWLGYEIVKSYVEKTGISLAKLMKETDHVKIFTQSGYKPKK